MSPINALAEYLCPECERVFETDSGRCPYDGSRLVSLGAGLVAGTVIDNRYTIRRLLGKGGMGTVYVARQHAMDRDVAIKLMHHRADGNHTSVQRFFGEVRAARRLQNPHTITVFDFGQTERGSLYLAMELLKGATLGHLLSNEQRLSPGRAVHVAIQVCRSLEEAHAHGIVHRDLKPENIYLAERGGRADFVKVLDFGVAKFLDPEGSVPLTQTGTVFGTPRYMSPEQANSEAVDARSDLYALGIVLYEMLAGVVPFREDNPLEVLYKQVHAVAPNLSEVAPWVPPELGLGALVAGMLAKRREDRPENARSVRKELERVLALLPEGSELAPEPDGRVRSGPIVVGERAMAETGIIQEPVRRAATATPALGVVVGGATLVGRGAAMALGTAALAAALGAGAPRVVWVSGEVGAGKSRYCEWLSGCARRDFNARVALLAHELALTDETAPLRGLVDDVLGTALLERDALRQRLEEHTAFSDRPDPELIETLVDFLRPSLNKAPPPADVEGVLFGVIHRLLVRLARVEPLLMVLNPGCEQAPLVLRFVAALVEVTARTPCRLGIVVQVTTVPGGRRAPSLEEVQRLAAWPGRGGGGEQVLVTLERLKDADFIALTKALGKGFGVLAPFLAYVSGGNPGATADVVRSIEQTPALLEVAKTWSTDGRRVPLSDLPGHWVAHGETLLEAARQRFGGRREREAVLRVAAALGADVEVDVLEQVLERQGKADAMEDALDDLTASGVLVSGDQGVLRFESGVVRELVLAEMRSPRAIAELHKAIAETLEALQRVEGCEVVLATHWALAGEHGRARDYRVAAARRARAQGQREEALQTLTLALEELRRQGTVGAALSEVLVDVSTLRRELGREAAAGESLRELLEVAQVMGDERLMAVTERDLGVIEDALSDFGRAASRFEAAAERFKKLGLAVEAARCDLARGASLEHRGELAAARTSYEAARRVFMTAREPRGLAEVHQALGLLALRAGDTTEALRNLRRAADGLKPLGADLDYAQVLCDLALAAHARRDYVLALDSAVKALELFDAAQHRVGSGQALVLAARVLMQQHRPTEARSFLERALRVREELGDQRGVGEIVAALAEVSLRLDQPERALELGKRARELLIQIGEFIAVASVLRTMGISARHLKRFEIAVDYLRTSISTYDEFNQRDIDQCLSLEALADCQEAMGLGRDARASLVTALERARQLDASHLIGPLEARLRRMEA